jgi:hypothetical protein
MDAKGWADQWWKALVEEPNDLLLHQLLSRPESHPHINFIMGNFTLFERVIGRVEVHYSRISAVLKANVVIYDSHEVLMQALRAHHFEVIQMLHIYGACFRRKDDIIECFNYFYMLSWKSNLKEEDFLQEASYYAHLRDQLFHEIEPPGTFGGWAYNFILSSGKAKGKGKTSNVVNLIRGENA